jgi:betaine-aldehyde dehydrogenase
VVENYIGIGIAEGARIVRGGTGMPAGLDRGWYVKPSLFAEVAPSSRLAQEEVFGPVLTISTYDSEDEAVQIANNSIYGLNGAIFSSDIEKAISIAGQIKTGTVEINGGGVGFHCPIGGVKMSGIGREAGPEGFDPYTEIKTIGLPRAYAETLSI